MQTVDQSKPKLKEQPLQDAIRKHPSYKYQEIVFGRLVKPPLRAKSLRETAEFYEKVLGFTVKRLTLALTRHDSEWGEGPHLTLQRDNCRLTFSEDEKAEINDAIHFEVSNLGAYFDSVVAKLPDDHPRIKLLANGNPNSPFPYCAEFAVKDPNGYRVRFVSAALPAD